MANKFDGELGAMLRAAAWIPRRILIEARILVARWNIASEEAFLEECVQLDLLGAPNTQTGDSLVRLAALRDHLRRLEASR